MAQSGVNTASNSRAEEFKKAMKASQMCSATAPWNAPRLLSRFLLGPTLHSMGFIRVSVVHDADHCRRRSSGCSGSSSS